MRPFPLPLVALGLLLFARVAAAGGAPLVLVLSLDGMRPDYLERTELPAFARMAREGARAERMIPVFPTNTFPNHVSLATGTHPDRHGIVGNVFLDREKGLFRYSNDASWIEAEPIWVAAERQGVRAATFFWVGSETPWNGVAATHREAPFDERVTELTKVERILSWIDLPPAERPGLILSWWHGADHAGHRRGPDHRSVTAALREQDAALARLLAGLDARQLWDHTTLFVVSDHGMAEVTESIDVRGALRKAGVDFDLFPGGGLAQVYLRDPAQREAALAVVRGIPEARLVPESELRGRLRAFHPRRTGDLVLLTTPPHTFFEVNRVQTLGVLAGRLFGFGSGMHGFDPALPEMSALFLALGRGVTPGSRVSTVRAIDLAPTVARLLAIDPPRDAEGIALALGTEPVEGEEP